MNRFCVVSEIESEISGMESEIVDDAKHFLQCREMIYETIVCRTFWSQIWLLKLQAPAPSRWFFSKNMNSLLEDFWLKWLLKVEKLQQIVKRWSERELPLSQKIYASILWTWCDFYFFVKTSVALQAKNWTIYAFKTDLQRTWK